MRGSRGDAQAARGFTNRQAANRCESGFIWRPLRAAKFNALGLRTRDPSPDPLDDPFALELSDRRQEVELQAAGRRAGVDRLAEAHEGSSESLQLVEQHDEMLETPTEAIELPDGEHVEPAALRIGGITP